MKKKAGTTDGLAILNALFLEQDPELRLMVQYERRKMRIAAMLYEIRKKRGLTQGQVAKLIGTTTSVISRIEDADYEGHSLSTVERFCQSLGYEFKAEFKPQLAVSWTGSSGLSGSLRNSFISALQEDTWAEVTFLSNPTQCSAGEEQLKLAA